MKNYAFETGAISSATDAKIALDKQADKVVLKITVDNSINRADTPVIDTDFLGKTYYSNGYYENPDGTKLAVDHDFFGNARSASPVPGPFENIRQGENEFCVWKF